MLRGRKEKISVEVFNEKFHFIQQILIIWLIGFNFDNEVAMYRVTKVDVLMLVIKLYEVKLNEFPYFNIIKGLIDSLIFLTNR